MIAYAYTRVSTRDQDTSLQREAILDFAGYRKVEVIKVFSDKASGKNTNRIGFQKMVEALTDNPQGVEAVIIYKLDRLGRSISDLIKILQFFKDHNIQLMSVTDNLDTTTPQGLLMFHLISSFAEYERALINERTAAGMERAKNNGVKFGRKVKVLPMKEIDALLLAGVPLEVVAKKYKVCRATVYTKIKVYRAEQGAKQTAFVTGQSESPEG